jgi:hypothetical protein
MLANPTEFQQIDELDDTEYLWLCDDCNTIFDGKHAILPHGGLCDPCLIKKITKADHLEEDIPF